MINFSGGLIRIPADLKGESATYVNPDKIVSFCDAEENATLIKLDDDTFIDSEYCSAKNIANAISKAQISGKVIDVEI